MVDSRVAGPRVKPEITTQKSLKLLMMMITMHTEYRVEVHAAGNNISSTIKP